MATVGFNLAGAFKGLSLSSSSASSYLNGEVSLTRFGRGTLVCFPLRYPLTIESAHKKGAGSTKNGRDSIGKRLGVKIYGNQVAQPGAIIVRQRGTKEVKRKLCFVFNDVCNMIDGIEINPKTDNFHPGKNVGLGKDHTIFSLIDGLVKFEKYGPDRKKVSVYPLIEQPENPNSYRARKREYFRLQRERKKARKEGVVPPTLVLASTEESSEANPVC